MLTENDRHASGWKEERSGAYYTIFKELAVEDSPEFEESFLTSSPEAAILKDCYWRLMGWSVARFYWFSLFCIGNSLQCTRCDVENWGHFVPASWRTNSNQLNFMQHVAGTKSCRRNRTFSQKTWMSHEETLSATCPRNMSPSVCRPLHVPMHWGDFILNKIQQ